MKGLPNLEVLHVEGYLIGDIGGEAGDLHQVQNMLQYSSAVFDTVRDPGQGQGYLYPDLLLELDLLQVQMQQYVVDGLGLGLLDDSLELPFFFGQFEGDDDVLAGGVFEQRQKVLGLEHQGNGRLALAVDHGRYLAILP